MSLRALGTSLHQGLRRLISLGEFAPLHVIRNQLPSSQRAIRIEFNGALVSFVRALEHGLATVRIICIVIAAQTELLPSGSISRIDLNHMLKNGDRILIRTSVVRQCETVEIKVVGLGVLRTRAGIEESAASAQCRQQLLSNFGGHLRLQRDQVLSRSGHIGLPQKTVALNLDRFQRNHQAVALFQKVPGENCSDMNFFACLLRIHVVAHKFSRDRRWPNVERTGVRKRIGDFIGQREAQKLHADVAIHILQRQHRNRILRRTRSDRLPLLEPPRSHRKQNREQNSANTD